MDWAHTTAPPVARAAKILRISTLIRSTRATLDTAASPAAETMVMSAMPTMTERNCSMIRGRISLRRESLLNTEKRPLLPLGLAGNWRNAGQYTPFAIKLQ